MMECKKLLVENGGDMEKAIDAARKKGVKTSVAERTASEGRVIAIVSEDKNRAAIVEINCNTDFTAKSEPVLKLGTEAARQLAHNPNADIAQAIQSGLTEVSQTTGENVRLGKNAVLTAAEGGKAGLYLYGITGKIGVVMSFTGQPSEELIKQIGGHIAFAKPIGLTRDEVPADLVEKERAFSVEQAKATGKPQNIAEKIAEGKMNAFFKERVLGEQDYINADKFKGSLNEMLKKAGAQLVDYVRLEVGVN